MPGSGSARITGSPSRTWPSRTTQAFSAKPAAESAANIAKDLGIALVEESAIQRDAFRYRYVISNDMLRSLYESYGNRWLYPAAFGDLPDQKVWRVLFVLAAERFHELAVQE